MRKTKVTNSRDNGAVSDVSSSDMRCFGGSPGKAVATVAAGSTLGFVASSGIMHFGPCQFYMARVPEEADMNTWEAAGEVWFKAGSISAVVPPGGGALKGDEATWPAYRRWCSFFYFCPLTLWKGSSWVLTEMVFGATDKTQVSFTVPKKVPSGNYLVRVESIALHLAQNAGGAQFYISCGQITVTGGGDGTPGPLVAFPGAYKASDPGLIWPNSPPRTSYTAPGPAVWEG